MTDPRFTADFWDQRYSGPGQLWSADPNPALVFESAGQAVALRRVADAEEIAGAVAFLASRAASYVNGTTLSAMGGMPALG